MAQQFPIPDQDRHYAIARPIHGTRRLRRLLTKKISCRPALLCHEASVKQKGVAMSYLVPSEFAAKMVDAGESKVFMSTRDTVIRAYMAGAILALAAWFAVTINVQTGQPLAGAILFPVGFLSLIHI